MLHTEDYEILLPDRLPKNRNNPFILSVGPTFTMGVPIILMALFGSKIYGSNNTFVYMMLITGGSGCLLGIIWGCANYFYKKRIQQKEENARREEFELYINKTRKYLIGCMTENREYMLNKYQSSGQLLNKVKEEELFRRLPEDEDFGFIRLAIGNIKFQMNVYVTNTVKEMFPGKEIVEANNVVKDFEILNDVPVGIDFIKDRLIGFDYDSSRPLELNVLLSMVCQLCYNVDPGKLRLCVFYDMENVSERGFADSIKWLPHVWAKDGNCRMLCGDRQSMQDVLPAIEKLSVNKDEKIVIIILNDKFLLEETALYGWLEGSTKTNIYVWYCKDKKKMPANIRNIVNREAYKDIEGISISNMEEFGRRLSGMNIQAMIKEGEIPDHVDILELYDSEFLDQIDICANWSNNRPEERLKVPIGLGSNGRKIYLDIHEKFHGPHGIVAGTTGSGKSELLQTYIVSMCLSFSPEDVNFFLIDYKGGGTGNKIEGLPHCAGVISNLSGSQIQRAIKAIASENIRRQTLLSKASVSHIDEYQRLYKLGSVEEAMPHLVLIIDEFAELKKEEPDFMQQIISLAAVGRSLGIHLVLSTQKPAGVVDDKIWSNSNFKLCLKVQDRQDSIDMLHRPEASYLTNPGQCYIEIGNNEYFDLFMCGYCGGYLNSKEDNNPKVYYLTPSGKRLCIKPEEDNNKGKGKLESLVDFITDASAQMKIKPVRNLYLSPIPDYIEYDAGHNKLTDINNNTKIHLDYDGKEILLGVYDDPCRQVHGIVTYNPKIHGNMAAAGGPRTGKTNLLMTIMSQLRSEDEALTIDISQKDIHTAKHSCKVLGRLKDNEETDIFFYHLSKEFEKHKNKEKTNRLFILIDNFGTFYKSLTENEQELILKMLAEGIGYSIYFLITGNGISDFTQKIFIKIKTTLCFEMMDSFQYGDVIRQYHIDVYPQNNTPGRCLFKIDEEWLESQIVMVTGSENLDNEEQFPSIPKKPVYESFINESSGFKTKCRLPIGYSLKTGYVRGVDMRAGSFIIAGNDYLLKHELLKEIQMTMVSFGGSEDMIFHYISDGQYSVQGIGDLDCADIGNLLMKSKAILIEDIYSFVNLVEKQELKESIWNYLEASAEGRTNTFIVAVFNSQKDADIVFGRFFRAMTDYEQGIYIGGNVATQRVFDFGDLSFSMANMQMDKGCGLMKIHGYNKTVFLKLPILTEEISEDDYD